MASHDKKTRGEAGFIYSAVDSPESGAVEEGVEAPRHNFFTRLYTGTGAFEVIGKRRLWFAISGAIIVIAIVSIVDSRVHARHRLPGRHQGVVPSGRRHGPAGRRRVPQDHGP